MSIHRPGDDQCRRLGSAAAALWVLPLWVAPFPPMVDYPQQLALAAILRWYGDPARRFRETYELALWAPHGLFKLLVAGLAWVLPINVAGRLVVSLSLVAVGVAALALCRRAGRPPAYALLALSLTYNYAFFWGFVDNLLAYPLALGGVALADGLFDRPFTARSWLALAAVGVLFYTVHLQFLLLFAGAVGWIAVCRLPGWRRLALWLSALVPGLAAGLAAMAYGVLRSPAGVITAYERRMRQAPPVRLPVPVKLVRVPDLLFGPTGDWRAWTALALLMAVVALAAVASRERRDSRDSRDMKEDGAPSLLSLKSLMSLLFRTRFATLAGWLAVLYLALPEFRGGYLIAQRIAPFAAMVAVTALPVPRPDRRRLVAWAAAALVVFQLGQTLEGFLRFRTESEGLAALLAETEPGQSLAGLTFERSSASWPGMPVYLHFPAYYQVYKGGRILFSFAELFQTSARFRPGQSWDDLLAEWNEWSPQLFDWDRHAGRFRYFLVRGDLNDVAVAFGREPAELGLSLRRAGRWWLFERQAPGADLPPPDP
ncbi:MAG TPA: hypothetical protein VIA62_04650 [Thermoanaerobaculia bacterium]|jgi:hypothetical protein|nr:hypothetical protein [Thermoanaerobaculia bacterium]